LPKHAKLGTELAIFEKYRKDWSRDHTGEYVLIHQNEVAGFHADYASALRKGLELFGVKSDFLVKQVNAEEPILVIY